MTYTVLITGCSTGIGRALANEFHRLGHTVYATARRVETISDLTEKGMKAIQLDVTDEDSIEKLKSQLAAQNVKLNVLINNAGYGAMGPLVEFPMAELRRQFETNVYSIVAMTQALLPAMMGASGARIVNISSISGVTTTPFSGAYCASKSAVNAMSDALRMELAPFGIKVITVQPGGIASDFGSTANKLVADLLRPGSLYEPMRKAILERSKVSQSKSMPADEFARALAQEILSTDPEPIVRIGPFSRMLPFMKRWMPTRKLDRMLSQRFGVMVSR